ncbi:MAG: nitroreductase family protein [Oscillospiraceae bacterium]
MDEIFSRTSVRSFKDTPVEPEKIEMLMRAAMAAPSGGNQQPWEFVVVTDKKQRERLGKSSPYAGPAAAAPLTIAVLSSSGKMRFPELWQQDLGAASENILLEAVHLGLGGVWLGIAPLEDRMAHVAEVLGLPEGVMAYCLLAIGYPDGPTSPKKNYDPSRVHYDRY